MEIQHFSHPDHKLTLVELESKEDEHESDDGSRRHSTRDSVKFESYTWDRAKDRAKDEADFHPAESDRITESQATQSMSKKNGATTSLDSKCKDNEQLFSHPSHPHHKLTLLQQEPKEDESDDRSSEEKIKYCNDCNEVMCFPGYACHHESAKCKFYLHKSCAELPPKILHPLHPHPLTCSLTNEAFMICDGCRDLYRSGFIFNCSWWCVFNLDAKCASKQDQEHHQTFKELTLDRFYHKHALKLCNIRKSHNIKCLCCTLIISGSAYFCLQCQFFIHESCKEITEEVEHPFHPQHILVFQNMDDYRNCAACLLSISTSSTRSPSIHGIGISCKECDFNLHVSCANQNRWASPLKHNCHEHNMFYFIVNKDRDRCYFECNKCHEKCVDDEPIYRCVECDFNLHLKCIPIPSVVMITQKHHHPLTLIDSVKEDNPLIQYLMDSNDKVDYSVEYYCDVCETPGNPRRHAYCCKECIYIAHVECIICEEQEGLASKEKGRKDTIQHFFHQHQLKLHFFLKKKGYNKNPSCCWCYKEIHGPGYCCDDCKFHIDDFCRMEISPQLQHPLHPHPLHLKHNFAHDGTTRMCRACRNPKVGSMLLSCEECNFDLHSACAKIMKQLSLKHECHNHNLYFAFDLIMKNEDSELLEDNVLYCNKCHDTGGSFYCCRECDINFHFECIPLPCDVKHKCHRHPLTLTYSHIFEGSYIDPMRCAICKAGYLIAGHPIFICAECGYFSFVHIECAISEDDTAVEVLKYLNPRPEKEQRSSTGDHHCSEKKETLALELEALEEKPANKAS
ncbi:hypothetical protein Q3G72_007073 [Acer saccharum]|nr:hypothetical protein Q3G72_007073 [Acer saccharum]